MEIITGIVERITYQNEENGYSVIKVRVKGFSELITLTGKFISINIGMVIEAKGDNFMNTILELREKRTKLWENAKDFLDSKRNLDGLISTEDAAVYDKMEADVVNLGKEIDRLEKQSVIDMELNKPIGLPILEKPTNKKVKLGRASDEYRKDFLNVLRGKPQIYNIMQKSVDADGGFLVPQEVRPDRALLKVA